MIKQNPNFKDEIKKLYNKHFLYEGKKIGNKEMDENHLDHLVNFSKIFISKSSQFNLHPFLQGVITNNNNIPFLQQLSTTYGKRNNENNDTYTGGFKEGKKDGEGEFLYS